MCTDIISYSNLWFVVSYGTHVIPSPSERFLLQLEHPIYSIVYKCMQTAWASHERWPPYVSSNPNVRHSVSSDNSRWALRTLRESDTTLWGGVSSENTPDLWQHSDNILGLINITNWIAMQPKCVNAGQRYFSSSARCCKTKTLVSSCESPNKGSAEMVNLKTDRPTEQSPCLFLNEPFGN